jgi:nicotinate phosphoribosyltransferase
MLERSYGLTTDLYELTMAAAYFESGFRNRAIFELFVRRLPPHRNYLIFAGLQQALDYLSSLRFTPEEIAYVREHSAFKDVGAEFFDYLSEFRFTGDVWSLPEGTAAFGMEPMLRVEAPIIEAQIVETFLLSTINFQTMIASKASRVVTAARGRSVIEFGTRRAHGTEAGLLAARAAYIGGCAGTSNVEAGHLFGIPTFGTLAHSFVMSFDDEDEAFRAFLKVFPQTATVLVDTYDTIAAVKRLAREFGPPIPAVRLDSGDLLELSKSVRRILDEHGMNETKIFASSDLNEYRIQALLNNGACIDAFGVGTELATSFDSPALSGVYKLAAVEQDANMEGRIKLSHDKASYPGAKQAWRLVNNETYSKDLVAAVDEPPPDPIKSWRPLLAQVMKQGHMLVPSNQDPIANLETARDRRAEEVSKLPAKLHALETSEPYPVEFSQRLKTDQENLERRATRNNLK